MFSSAVSSIMASEEKFYLLLQKPQSEATPLIYLLCSNSGHLSVFTQTAQEFCTNTKAPELPRGTSSSHGLWASWDLEPTVNSGLKQLNSVQFISSKRKIKLHLLWEWVEPQQTAAAVQVRRRTSALLFPLSTPWDPLTPWRAQNEEFGFPSECKAILSLLHHRVSQI